MSDEVSRKLLDDWNEQKRLRESGSSGGNGDRKKEEWSPTPIEDALDGNEHDDENENGNGNNDSNKKKIELAFKKAEEIAKPLFKDQYGVCYAWLDISNHKEVLRIESSKFKRLLIRLFYNNVGYVPGQSTIDNWIHVFHATADFEGPTYPLSVRVTWYNGDIYYDLTNEKWQCVKITKEGWELLDETPIPLFTRHKQIPQATPDQNYESDINGRFLELINLKEARDKILLRVYIASLLIPDIPHVILMLHGKQGSAKTTLQKMIKSLIDPATPSILTIRNDVRELIQQLDHNHVAYYDNLKKAPGWLSDEACKAVTGVGSTKRKLYSDDDDIVYEYKRCLGFSGINTSLTEPDALDRSITIELLRIVSKDRKVENELLAKFFELRPKLLGYFLDIIVKALQIKDSIKLNDLPRMADFALWGEAIARAMGYKDLEFINAYYENIGKQNIEAIENHPLGQVLARYIGDYEVCEGSATEVHKMLEEYAIENKINIDDRLWPKAPNSFTRRLNQISSNLLEGLGIDVQITRMTDVKGRYNTSNIKIVKIPPVCPVSPGGEKHEGKQTELPGDTEVPGDTIPPVSQIPPVVNAENRAQNEVPGHTGDTGDILHTEGGKG